MPLYVLDKQTRTRNHFFFNFKERGQEEKTKQNKTKKQKTKQNKTKQNKNKNVTEFIIS